jgi:hypothetical protein
VTGIGTPVANLLTPYLASVTYAIAGDNTLWEYANTTDSGIPDSRQVSSKSFLSMSSSTDAFGSPVAYGIVQDTVNGYHVNDLSEFDGGGSTPLSTGSFLSISAAPGGVVYGIV